MENMTSFLIGWPGGSLESALKLGALILISYALVLWLSAVIWVYRDVKNRTRSRARLMGIQRARPSHEILSGDSADVYFARADSILLQNIRGECS